jgi:hypothetical protein
VLMEEIIRARFPRGEWNIYGAQASDGDNWHDDSPRCRQLLEHEASCRCAATSPTSRWSNEEQSLWHEYASLADETSQTFAMRKASGGPSQIYPVFRDLFRKEGAAAMSDSLNRRQVGQGAIARRVTAAAVVRPPLRAPLPPDRSRRRTRCPARATGPST